MSIFDKMKEPVFLKESSDAGRQLEVLKALEPSLNEEGKVLLRQNIQNLEYGIVGENTIAYELKNSHIPMYVLHDIYLESGEQNAQIDYLVFTRKLCFVIECKNLYGNIEIDNKGAFIRTSEFRGRKKREGIYSPITQNQRHLELMKKLKVESKDNFLLKHLAEKQFDNLYRPIVVLANPKTVLYDKYAKKEIKEKVIRADQLIAYIKKENEAFGEAPSSDSELLKWAQGYLDMHQEKPHDYTGKYQKYKLEAEKESASEKQITEKPDPQGTAQDKGKVDKADIDDNADIEKTKMYIELKAYRLAKSREEGIKAYYICTDLQLKELAKKAPQNPQELKEVPGFGDAKAKKYGEDILSIIQKNKGKQ